MAVEASDTGPSTLTTRALDLWVLGGLSLVLWVVMTGLSGLRSESWAVDHHFANLAALSGTMALVCNYPHFMASYRLGYGQGLRFILAHWIQLIAVPVALLVALWVAYTTYLDPTSGPALMSLLLNIMFFSVGWHYAKQVYGCMRVYAAYDSYSLSPGQWRLVRWSLYGVWATSFVHANIGEVSRTQNLIPYQSLNLPPWMDTVALVGFVYLLSAVILLLWQVHRQTGRRPSAQMMVAPVAFVFWWWPPLVQHEFYVWLVPFFHSLQYLGFVYKVEHERLAESGVKNTGLRGGGIALGLVVAGFLAFEFIPNTMDVALDTQTQFGGWFFFAAAVVFINVHHYFIDNVIWRFSSPRLRHLLLER